MLKKSSLREKALLILSESTHLDIGTAKTVLEEDIRPLVRLFSKSKLALQIIVNSSRTSRSIKSLKTIERRKISAVRLFRHGGYFSRDVFEMMPMQQVFFVNRME